LFKNPGPGIKEVVKIMTDSIEDIADEIFYILDEWYACDIKTKDGIIRPAQTPIIQITKKNGQKFKLTVEEMK